MKKLLAIAKDLLTDDTLDLTEAAKAELREAIAEAEPPRVIQFSVKIQSIGMNQSEPQFRAIISSPAANVTLSDYRSEEDVMAAALAHLRLEWKRRDFGKLFPSPAAADDDGETKYEVIDLDEDESHGHFDTLEEARGCVKFDKLRFYEIRHKGVRVEHCEPYEGDDDRAKQGVGMDNASER